MKLDARGRRAWDWTYKKKFISDVNRGGEARDWGLMYRARSSGAQEALDTRVQPAGTQCPKYRLGFGGIGACRIESKWQEETRRARVTETRRWNDASQTSSTSATCQGTMRRWHDN
jgi:hypothetical protein